MPANHRRKRKKAHTAETVVMMLMILLIVLAIYGIIRILCTPISPKTPAGLDSAVMESLATEAPPTEPPTEAPTFPVTYPEKGADTIQLTPAVRSQYAVLIDADNHHVLAEKGSDTVIYPASMTKMMTLIVAIEHIENFEDTFTMTEEILSPLYYEDASMAGFQVGEECTMMDLLYGAALPSGADATTALAISTAGSEAAFVGWMNEKVEELGLQHTHFMNASGLHDPQHVSTVTEMGMILEYCLKNEICKEVLSTYMYQTRVTEQSPEGIQLYDTMFSRMYGDEVEGISILGGKTGYTDEAGQCLASYAQTPDGHTYVAVTAKADSLWYPIFDAFGLYGLITGTYDMTEPETEAESDEVQGEQGEADWNESPDEYGDWE